MLSFTDKLTVIQNQDEITSLNGGDAMSDDKRRQLLLSGFDVGKNGFFGIGVNRTERVI
jgi:hypothetical protein